MNREGKLQILRQLLNLADRFEVSCVLSSFDTGDPYSRYQVLAGFGEKKKFVEAHEITEAGLKFGFVSYDYKNRVESLHSANPSQFSVPDFYFFEPEYYFLISNDNEIQSNLPFSLPDDLGFEENVNCESEWHGPLKEDYTATIDAIREDIRNGEYYELNFCTEWKNKIAGDFKPKLLHYRLVSGSAAPFQAYFKLHQKYLLCNSPERFLSKRGDKLTSQPIKGTQKRSLNETEDLIALETLKNSTKDRAENIMITDLVRNDLSRVCLPGTVEVLELCGIRSFDYVYQMVSTIAGVVEPDRTFKDILHATFPMGSMTGAPKIRVMQRIEELENFQRGWYSGSVGYMLDGDFDLNVVIRSLQYNAESKTLAYHTGGAITYDSIPEDEFTEIETKAIAIRRALI